jgi:hypothetical protein
MDQSKNNNSEEVDLGQLFNAIGAGIRSVFRFFKNLLFGLANWALEGILFVRQRFLVFGIISLLGASFGAYIDYIDGPRYASKMILATNYGSGKLLYNEVEYLAALLKQNDTSQLHSRFNIKPSEAEMISKIKIEPIVDPKEELLAFDAYRLKMDTTMVSKSITFSEYKDDFEEHQYRRHIIEATVYDRKLLSKIESGLLNALNSNKILQLENQIGTVNLSLVDEGLKTSMARIDSLLLAEQKALEQNTMSDDMSGTSINLTENTRNTKEVQLVELKIHLMDELQLNNEKNLIANNITNVITSFDEMVYKETAFTKKGSVKYGVIAFLALSMFYAIMRFDKFLKEKIDQKANRA